MVYDFDSKKKITERVLFAIGSVRGAKAKIARALNITPQAVNGWARRKTIDKDHLPLISNETGVNLGWLMTGKGEPYGPQGQDSIYLSPSLFTSQQRKHLTELLTSGFESGQLNDQDAEAIAAYIAGRMSAKAPNPIHKSLMDKINRES